jgi:hypothetical protein
MGGEGSQGHAKKAQDGGGDEPGAHAADMPQIDLPVDGPVDGRGSRQSVRDHP